MRPAPCGSGKRYKECHGALVPPVAVRSVLQDDVAANAQAALSAAARRRRSRWLQRAASMPSPKATSFADECAQGRLG
jgi:hypothetical protein